MTPQKLKTFDEIQVGDAASLVRKISLADVQRFVELTGDDNRLHVDRVYAESTPFKDIVVHGMLGASFLSTLIGTRLPGEGALWVSQSFEFLHPVRIDDTLTVTCTVRAKNDRERLLELDARIENQWKKTVLSGRGTVRVLKPAVVVERPVVDRPQVAIVVGGAGGIGRAVCRRLSAAGLSIVVAYRTQQTRADELVAEIQGSGGQARGCQVDVTDQAAVENLVETAIRAFGGLGVVVHSASPAIHPMGFPELEWSEVQAHLESEVHGAFLLAKACYPVMREQGYGRIVAITSQVLDGAPTPKWTAYSVGKAALATFARSLAVELGPLGITVNCVSPGMTDTALIGDIPERMRLVLERQVPLRRLASPDDIAAAVAFLVSPEADYITGETIRVNGGQITL
jgi:3-oxoacyl-[acyl-carrier protein] reductase